MAVAPQINEDLFGTKVFTVIFTIRDSGDTTDRTDAGYLEVIGDGGATITGDGTPQLTIEGTQGQVNTAMGNLNYVPSADFEGNVGMSYAQTDDNGTSAPGSNPFSDFMSMSLRDTHSEYEIKTDRTYDENRVFIFGDFMQIKDLRGDSLPDTQYAVDITVDHGELPQSSFTGTKAEVNEELSNATFWPPVDFRDDDITFGYSQTQTTDSKVHATNDTSGVLTFGNIDEKYEIVPPEYYGHNEILDMAGVFNVTDGRPDYIDPNIQYTVTVTVSRGQLSQSTFTGTKTEVNAQLALLSFVAPAESYSDASGATVTFGYSQTQTTDGIVQADDVQIHIPVDPESLNPDYDFGVSLQYEEDNILPLPDAFRITDLRPDNIDPNIQYTVTLTADNGEVSHTSISGTKAEVNATLEQVYLIPDADYTGYLIEIAYAQTQTTDGIVQADGIAEASLYHVSFDQTSEHDDYIVYTEQFYSNITDIWDIGQITDLRPDNVDANIQYEIVFTFPSEAGKLYIDSIEVVGNTITGTKTEVNDALSKIEFRQESGYVADFTLNYAQTQITDGGLQGSVDILVKYSTKWEEVFDGSAANEPSFSFIEFHDTRWVTGRYNNETILKTENEGATWDSQTLEYAVSTGSPWAIDCAIDTSGIGLLLTVGGLFKTTNGGDYFYDQGAIFDPEYFSFGTCIEHDGANDFVICLDNTDDYIKITRDGGQTFTETNIDNVTERKKIYSAGVDSNGAWLFGGENVLAQTTSLDDPIYVFDQSISVNEIRYDGVFLIAADDGIYRRDDGAHGTQTIKVSDLVIRTLDSDGTIWRAVVNGNEHYYSSDDGDTWIRAILGNELENEDVNTIRYDHVSGYWVLGTAQGRIFRSVNP